jgi:hypothetical protein
MILIAKKYASPAFAAVLLALILTGCKQSAGGGTEGASSSKSGGGDAKKQAASGKSVSGSAGSTADTEGKPDRSSEGGAQPNDVVRISAEDQRRGGVQTDYVLVQRVPRSLSVAGQVAMDELHTSHVGTIADGRITAVNVLPGAMVHRGQVLGSLHSHSVHESERWSRPSPQSTGSMGRLPSPGRLATATTTCTPSRRLRWKSRSAPTRTCCKRNRCSLTHRPMFAWNANTSPSYCRCHLNR